MRLMRTSPSMPQTGERLKEIGKQVTKLWSKMVTQKWPQTRKRLPKRDLLPSPSWGLCNDNNISRQYNLRFQIFGSVPTTPDPNTSAKVSRYKWEAYRDTNWCIYYGLPQGGHTFAKVCHRNGRCIAILFHMYRGQGSI